MGYFPPGYIRVREKGRVSPPHPSRQRSSLAVASYILFPSSQTAVRKTTGRSAVPPHVPLSTDPFSVPASCRQWSSLYSSGMPTICPASRKRPPLREGQTGRRDCLAKGLPDGVVAGRKKRRPSGSDLPQPVIALRAGGRRWKQ